MSDPIQIKNLIPPDTLATEDLLVALTGRPEARGLVERHPLRDLAGQTLGELRAAGLTPAASWRLAAAFELGRRVSTSRLEIGAKLRSSAEIYEVYRARFENLRVEQFWAVFVDAKNCVRREHMISQGTLSASLVHPRETFSLAIRESAAGIVLVHGHPSGDPSPSPEDHEVTRRLVAVGELVGIRVLDHLVIGDGRYVSFLERGLIPG